MRLEEHLSEVAGVAIQTALGLDEPPAALLRPTDRRHGDFQVNAAMALAKKLKKPPRELATLIAGAIHELPEIESAEVAGPGFVNLRLNQAWVAAQLISTLGDAQLGVPPVSNPETIVIDYSSPNIAKQMHVGHLRSTIIGHALAQLLKFVGHNVISDNHLGDWGTQFGWLIVGMRELGDDAALQSDPIAELERVYREARKRGKEDEVFAAAARAELAKLQAGDRDNLALWKHFVTTTRASLERVYAQLGVQFDHWLGESAYHNMLPAVIDELLSRRIAREDAGAICVFFNELDKLDADGSLADIIPKKLRKQKEPFIVRKQDGAFLYSTTDIATVQYRKREFQADRSIYVVGSTQALHFEQLFAVARLLGLRMGLDHVAFGQILGADGKVMRTSAGDTVKLQDLLTAAKTKAAEKIEEQRESGRLRIADDELDRAHSVIGIGAVKYNDLMKNRSTDYRFDLETMVDFAGNAGPYLQYQYARARSIFDNGNMDWDAFQTGAIELAHEQEVALAKRLLKFSDVVHRAAEAYLPNLLCEHLYEVASEFSTFHFKCNVLKSEGETRTSRLALTRLAGQQLQVGLGLLGIEVIERM